MDLGTHEGALHIVTTHMTGWRHCLLPESALESEMMQHGVLTYYFSAWGGAGCVTCINK